MPGAASIVATNYLYNVAKPDGLTLGAHPAGDLFRSTGRPARSANSISPRSPGSARRNRTTSFTTCAPIRPIESSKISARPRSRPAAAARAPARLDFTSRVCSMRSWAPNTPLSAAIPAARRSIWRSSAAKFIAGRRLVATYFGREPYISWQKKGFVRVLAPDQPQARFAFSRTCQPSTS